MKFIHVFLVLAIFTSCNVSRQHKWEIKSPDNNIIVNIELSQRGDLTYKISKHNNNEVQNVIESSPLGIIRTDDRFESLNFKSASNITFTDEYFTSLTGKSSKNRNHYTEVVLRFENKSSLPLDIVFRVFNKGVAFKYVFPDKQADKLYRVIKELTGFNISEGLAWMQPYDSITPYAPAYERNFLGPMEVGTTSPESTGWCFPALFEKNDNWILITESNLKNNFYASHLSALAENGLYKIVPPEQDEGFGYGNSYAESTLPWDMPWRVIISGDSPGDIVESNIVNSLGDPSVIDDTSWIKPGRASWAWWSGHLDRSRDTPEKLKHFIDFAQEMGWEYSLVDAGWDKRPGLDIEELVRYASDRNVDLLLWYNAGGPINRVRASPRDKMFDADIRKKEMEWLSYVGIKGIKVDFFCSDKQDYIKLYLDILKDAAEYQLLVNFHGSTLPRGWERTYPNLMTSESVKGAEAYIYHDDFEENSPRHNTILPFTRNVVGSMDYTPVSFSEQRVQRKTTNGHELALAVLFESGIQHFPDTPEMYKSQPVPVQEFLKNVPVSWDNTKFISGYPGRDIVLARQKNDEWFVGGINGTGNYSKLEIDFRFLMKGNYTATIISDGNTPEEFNIINISVDSEITKQINSLPYGGFVMHITKCY